MIARSLTALFALAAASAVLSAQTAAHRAADGGRQELVITNQNLGVVLESRTVPLPAGRAELLWDGAPASARTETWTVTNPGEAGVRWLGLTAPLPGAGAGEAEWLAGLVGRRVRIVRPGGSTAEGEILAVHGPTPAQVLFREGNELVYGEPEARLSLTADAGATDRPAGVILKLESNRAGSRTLTSRYLVSDVGWEASYALTLAPDEKRGRLEASFIVDNRTGTDFSPARLRLLAGTLRAAQPPMPKMMAQRAAVAEMVDVAQSTELSESRVYEVATPPRLPAGRTTFPLATDADVAVEKRYVARSTYWMGVMEEPQRIPVGVQYRLQTKPLARALPAGVVRVYAESGAVFTGEDRIEHTPERTDVEIETSEAFDLTARRRQVSFAQTSRTESESSYEVVITSRKKEAVTVLVRDQFPGDWTIVESSVAPKKLGAFTAEFPVNVPAGGEAKLTYRVKVRMRG
jgi:hypothetical protein